MKTCSYICQLQYLIVSSTFFPEPITSAQTSTEIAEALAQCGYCVRVISPYPNRPAGRLYPGYIRGLFTREYSEQGFEILRCFSIFSPYSLTVSRFLENLSFGITSGFVLLIGHKPDAVYANTWPILAQGVVALICKIRRIPLILSIQDIYPESLLVQKRIRNENSWGFRILSWMDALITKNSAAVIVISEQFRDLYLRDRKLPPEKVYVVPNWIDENALVVNPPNNPIRSEHKIPDNAFLVAYGGNIGKAASVENVIKAFTEIPENEEIYLLIAGDGSEFDRCQKLARASNNNRILFHCPWLADETSTLLGAADLCILPTQGEQSLVSVPSKLFLYMLASRPVLALALPESDIARVIRDSDCGWVIAPGDSKKLTEQVVEISKLPRNELWQRGEAGRNFAKLHYSKSTNLPKVIETLEQVANKE